MNKVFFIGRLTKDPEIRYSPETQMAVGTFNLAIDRIGSKEKKADFPRITVFGKTAENAERFLHKGSLIAVDGSIQTGDYTDKNGNKVYRTDVIATRIEFLESRKETTTTTAEEENPIPAAFKELNEDIPF